MPTPVRPEFRPPRPATRRPVPPAAARLGWDAGWDTALASVPTPVGTDAPVPTPVLARVARVHRGACDVLLATGTEPTPAAARWSPAVTRAARDDPAELPVAGDWVLLEPVDGSDPAAPFAVTQVLPRRTSVQRLEVSGSSHAQVLAANADVVAVVAAMVPDLDLGRVERLLALAWTSGARPVVLLTKADLHPDPGSAVALVAGVAAGCDVHALAAPDGTGLQPVRDLLLQGATVALVGASGVGKSTLLNALVGTSAMATRTLGAEGKGRHTTVTRELHLAPGAGAVLDTPGLRSVGLHGEEDVTTLFPEVDELAARCRFADCGHTVEPGCAVLAAAADGTLPQRRLESYRALAREAEFVARRTDARLRAEHTRELKARTREYRRRPDKKR